MKKIKILLVGIGGYGNIYVKFFKNHTINIDDVTIEGVVDISARECENYHYFCENNIEIFETMEDFYKDHKADLVIISTPTPLHMEQCILAMKNGSNVLCEKPLTSAVQDMNKISDVEKTTGRSLGVGFQWSFCEPMLKLKKDILSGVLGKAKRLKTFISWPRDTAYYTSSTWKGRIYSADGTLILDSIVTNAASHYLHNILFLMGSEMDESEMPEELHSELYRVKNIESFDTCFLKGKFKNGAGFLYLASHSTDVTANPKLEYEFENATVTLNCESNDNILRAKFKDGTIKNYGMPFSVVSDAQKLKIMLDNIRSNALIPCRIKTVIPHMTICDALFDYGNISTINEGIVELRDGVYCKQLYDDMEACFKNFLLPSEDGCHWASKAEKIELNGYTEFLELKKPLALR